MSKHSFATSSLRPPAEAMGAPTEGDFDDQDGYSGFGTSFTAFYDVELKARQLQSDGAKLTCSETRQADEP